MDNIEQLPRNSFLPVNPADYAKLQDKKVFDLTVSAATLKAEDARSDRSMVKVEKACYVTEEAAAAVRLVIHDAWSRQNVLELPLSKDDDLLAEINNGFLAQVLSVDEEHSFYIRSVTSMMFDTPGSEKEELARSGAQIPVFKTRCMITLRSVHDNAVLHVFWIGSDYNSAPDVW